MISIKDLAFGYNKQPFLFQDLNFEQRNGSILGLLGKNGAGKTTLLNIMSGLIAPRNGFVKINGFVPFERHPDFLKEVFFITEEPFFPPLSIDKYININAPFYANFSFRKMRLILKEFELSGDDRLHKISLGQKKKFIIAFALSTNCKLLIFDEPTNGLDIPSKSVFRKVMVSSIEDHQLAIISTHQVKDVETIIDRMVVLDSGKVIFEDDIYTISENYEFKKMKTVHPDAIYFEKCLGGYSTILPAFDDVETDVDIELLFNAITNDKDLKL